MVAAYFIYAIKAPISRKHFRIAHIMILPAFFVLSIATPPLDDIKSNGLMKEELQLEQQFVTQSSITTNAYQSFKLKEKPDSLDIQNVQDAAIKTHIKIQEILNSVQSLESENAAQFPSVGQKLTSDHFEKYKVFLQSVDDEVSDIQELMTYASKVNFNDLSQMNKEAMNTSA